MAAAVAAALAVAAVAVSVAVAVAAAAAAAVAAGPTRLPVVFLGGGSGGGGGGVLAVVGDIPVSCCYCDIRRLQHVQCPSRISPHVSTREWSGAFYFGGGEWCFVLFCFSLMTHL